MSDSDTLKWIVFSITLALLIGAVCLTTVIAKGKLVARTFRIKVWIILTVTIVQTGCNVYSIIDGTNSAVSRFPGSLAQWTIFFICFFNIHILQVFSVLNPKITKAKLAISRVAIILFYAPTAITQPWYWVNADVSNIPKTIAIVNNYGVIGFSVFAVFYDNIQGFYLIYLVLKNKKKKGNEFKKVLNVLVISFAILCLMDWIAVIMFACATYIPAISKNQPIYHNLMMLTDTYTGIHGTFMIYIFKLLTDFTFVDSKRYKIKKSKEKNPTQVVHSNVQDVNLNNVWILLALTIVQTSCNLLSRWKEDKSIFKRIPGCVVQWSIFVICFYNIHILQVFSVLSPSITASKLIYSKILIALLFLPIAVTQWWYILNSDITAIPYLVQMINSYSVTVFVILAMIFDNIQSIYLINLVLKNKKKRGQEFKKVFGGLVRSLIFLSLMDWAVLANFACACYIPIITRNDQLYSTLMYLTDTYTGIHAVSLTYVFKQLTDFTFADNKRKQAQKIKVDGSSIQVKEKSSVPFQPTELISKRVVKEMSVA
ncbi:hypothetical protein HDV06_001532 [Boothiomyces sp. JEL0866]|nr:hypothetical protein HDV06_001532 [Boothiomyces sp. JEL0866]